MSIMSQFQPNDDPPTLHKRDTKGCDQCLALEQENRTLRDRLEHCMGLIRKFEHERKSLMQINDSRIDALE
jgi:hypothetical protein